MKKIFILIIFVFAVTISNATNYYFSSLSGNDERVSTSPDKPWKTLNKLNSFFSSLQPGDSVLLKRGETFYGSIIVSRSGTEKLPIVIGAYGRGSRPVITSLVTLSNWSTTSIPGVYESYNELLPSSVVNIVLVNNEQQPIGRYPNAEAPNKGWLPLIAHTGTTSITHPSTGSGHPSTGSELISGGINWTGGELVIRRQHWIIDRNPITAHSGTTISYTTNYTTRVSEPKNGFGYFFQSHIETLDQQGEWYYNSATKKLSMYSPSTSPGRLATGGIQAATLKSLLSLSAKNDIVFDNLMFKGANENNLNINGNNIYIKNCDVIFSGMDAIRAKGNNFQLENSNVLNANNNGVQLKGSSSIVRNNLIKNTYHIAGMGGSGDGQGRAIGNTTGGLVEYNQIINSGYVGVQLGGDNAIVRYNLIDNFDFIKDDGGAIYAHNSSGETNSGRKITGNIILNGIGAKEGTLSPYQSAKGIYLDDYVNGLEITGNTVANCSYGYFFHSAYNNTVKNNTAYNNRTQVYFQNNGVAGKARGNVFVNNIFVSKLPTQYVFAMYTQFNDVDSLGHIDSNYYVRPLDNNSIFKATYKFNGAQTNSYFKLSQWKTSKPYDKNSKASPISFPKTINPDDVFKFEFNATKVSKTIVLDQNYIDIKGEKHKKVTLQPYTSVILMKIN